MNKLTPNGKSASTNRVSSTALNPYTYQTSQGHKVDFIYKPEEILNGIHGIQSEHVTSSSCTKQKEQVYSSNRSSCDSRYNSNTANRRQPIIPE